MSTKGVFVLRKDEIQKGMPILHDAYPDGVGADIIDLVKTTDLHALYDQMTLIDESVHAEEIPETEAWLYEPEPFFYGTCRLAVKKNKPIRTSEDTVKDIQNSLFCEYAYVIDLDTDQLMYFVGFQRKPQEGNPYGETPVQTACMAEAYYPCRLAAVFQLDYIRQADISHIVGIMESAKKDDHAVRRYDVSNLKEADKSREKYEDHKTELLDKVRNLNERLTKAAESISDCAPVCERRWRELQRSVIRTQFAVADLAEKIEIIK